MYEPNPPSIFMCIDMGLQALPLHGSTLCMYHVNAYQGWISKKFQSCHHDIRQNCAILVLLLLRTVILTWAYCIPVGLL